MRLSELCLEMEAIIVGFAGTLNEDFIRRLREVGFHEQNSVKCVRHTPFYGPKVYCVGNAIFSVANDIAQEIVVKVE